MATEIYLIFNIGNLYQRDFSCAVMAESAEEALQQAIPYIATPGADAQEIAEDLQDHVAHPLTMFMLDSVMARAAAR